MKRKQPTLRDVASATNLAVSTVSNILTNSPHSWASEGTRQRVLDAAATLGYRTNRVARSLAIQKTELLAMMIPDQRNPVYAEITHGAIMEAERNGYEVLLCATEDRLDLEREYVRHMIGLRCDGFVLMPVQGTLDQSVFADLARADRPTVVIGNPQPGIETDYISADFEKGAFMATRHLIGLGRRRIAFLSVAVTKELVESRQHGWERALTEAGLYAPEGAQAFFDHVGIDYLQGAYDAARKMFQMGAPRPDAVVCASDLIAIAFMCGVRECGLRVPDDVAVVGYDDIPMARYAEPPLTTINSSLEDAGRMAVRLLFDRMTNPQKAPTITALEQELVVRASCGAVLRSGAAPQTFIHKKQTKGS